MFGIIWLVETNTKVVLVINKSSKYHGVYFNKIKNKWKISIKYKKELFCSGVFNCEDEAAIYVDYIIESQNINCEKNFPLLSNEQLMIKYNEILDKYGTCKNERCSKSNQGKLMKSNKFHSKYVGVSKNTKIDSWVASIMKDLKQIKIGYFKIEDEAARAYDKKALELYGDNARLNFPKTKNESMNFVIKRLKEKTSKYRGVSLIKGKNKWRVTIRHCKVNMKLALS